MVWFGFVKSGKNYPEEGGTDPEKNTIRRGNGIQSTDDRNQDTSLIFIGKN